MIVSKETFRIKTNNRKWKTGYVQFKKLVGDFLQWEDRCEVMAILFKHDENPTAEQIQAKLEEYRKEEAKFNGNNTSKKDKEASEQGEADNTGLRGEHNESEKDVETYPDQG